MKIALIQPPGPDPPPNDFGPPWDMAMAAACLEAAGLSVRGFDWLRLPREALTAALDQLVATEDPDLIGIFFGYAQRHAAFAATEHLHALRPGLPIALAGELPGALPEEVLRASEADAVVLHEGEETWPELATALAGGRPLSEVAGLIIPSPGGPLRTPARPLRRDLDALPDPAYHAIARAEIGSAPSAALIPSDHCSSLGRALVVHGARGCQYRCSFCVESTRPSKIRALSPARLVDQLLALEARHGYRDFVFGDSLLTFDRGRALALAAELERRAPGLRWSAMTRTDRFDGLLAQRLAAGGCVEVAFGVESASPTIQRAIGKGLDPATIAPAFEAARAAGLRAVLMLMIGNPGETLETLRETIAQVRGLTPERVLIKVAKAEPGSRLWDAGARSGWTGQARLEGPEPHPPHWEEGFDAAAIDALRAGLVPRTSWLDLRSLATPEAALAAVTWAASRATRLVLGGGEPLARADIPALIRRAVASGAQDIALHTDARALYPARRSEAALGWGASRSLLVPWPLDALGERGVDAWRSAGGSVTLRAPVDRQAARAPLALAAALLARSPGRVVLYYGATMEGWLETPAERLPRPTEAARAGLVIARALRDGGAVVEAQGLPACLIGAGDPALWAAPHRPFDERVTGPSEATSLVAEGRARRARIAACGACAYSLICDGPWRLLVERFGVHDFEPPRHGA